MRSVLLTAMTGLLFVMRPAEAQNSLLDRVEKSLGGTGAAPQVNKGYLGFTPDENYTPKDGVRVVQVKPGGPADTAGLKANDLITVVDGKSVATLDEMDALLDKTTPGQQLRMTVNRGGNLQTITATLGQRPAAPPDAEANPGEATPSLSPPATTPPSTTPPAAAPPALGVPATSPPDPLAPPASESPSGAGPIRSRPLDLGPPPAATTEDPLAPAPAADASPSAATPAAAGGASLGITVVPLTEEARAAYGLSIRRGALITQIRPGSPADRAGLPLGAVIATVDGRLINTADDLVAFIRTARPGQEVELGYMQGDAMRRKIVRLGPTAAAGSADGPPATGGFSSVPPVLGDRPLLGRVERMMNNLESTRGASTVYDPSEMAQLKQQVFEMTEQIKSLQERLKAIEDKAGVAPPAPAPGAGGFTPMP
jgi:membrane-associated protease RseP (regulator of RpoE activity)